MNLSALTDFELDVSTENSAKNERSALHIVLEHLAEVHKRKSFSPQFKSIHAYAIVRLKYDAKSAWRRVNAMFLMTQLPEIAGSIQNGELDLSKLAAVQAHFRIENAALKQASENDLLGTGRGKVKLTKSEKLDVIKSVIGKTSRETMRSLSAISSSPPRLATPDLVKPLAKDLNEVRITLTDEDLRVLQDIKDLIAHKYPEANLSEIVGVALAEARESLEKKKAKSCGGASRPVRSEAQDTRAPGVAMKREIYERAQGKCEICGSKSATEYDHRLPFALGGKTTIENLRLVCRACNQRESIKIFGPYEHRAN